MMKLKITPKKIEPTLLRLVKQTIAASEYFESLEFRQETISKRTRTTSFIHRSKFVGKEISGALNKSGSMDELLKSIDWEDWEKNEKWKKFDSDSSSMEYSDGGNVVGLLESMHTGEGPEQKKVTQVVENEINDPSGSGDGARILVKQIHTDEEADQQNEAQVGEDDTTQVVKNDPFCEDDINQEEFINELNKGRKNQ